jgi:hypothetical protein
MLRRTSSLGREGAVDRPRGAEDKAKTAGNIAGEHPDLKTLRLCRDVQRQSARRQDEGSNRCFNFRKHFFNLLFLPPLMMHRAED